MMRSVRPIRFTLFAVAALLFALIALAPLRAALDLFDYDGLGLSARGATGSVWRGALHDARVGPIALGDVETRLHLLPMLAGRARLTLDSATFEASVVRTRDSFAFDSLDGRFALAPSITLEASGLGATFADGGCESASGRAAVALAGGLSQLGFPSSLAGEARCDRGALLLPLSGQAGRARLDMRIGGDGLYWMDFTIRPSDPSRIPALVAAGFRPAGNVYTKRIRGEF